MPHTLQSIHHARTSRARWRVTLRTIGPPAAEHLHCGWTSSFNAIGFQTCRARTGDGQMCRFQPSQTDQKRLLEHPFLTNCVEPPVFLFSRPRSSDSGPPSQTDQSHPNPAIPIAELVKVPLRQFQQFCQAHISMPTRCHFATCSIPGPYSARFLLPAFPGGPARQAVPSLPWAEPCWRQRIQKLHSRF